MLTQLIWPIFLSSFGILLLWLAIRPILSRKDKNRSISKDIYVAAFLVYSTCLLCITLYPTRLALHKTAFNGDINLIPFIKTASGLSQIFFPHPHYMQAHYIANIAGNILLFVPVGFLLPLISRINNLRQVLAAACITSLILEFAQFNLRFLGIYRSVDIDDVILNVSGALAGFFMLALKNRLVRFKT